MINMDNKQLKIINEILNDAFWLGYILEIKKNIPDYNKKEILSSFLVFFSSIFVEETIRAGYGGLSGKRNITLKDITDLRNHNLKYCPSCNSLTTKNTINEMEIDFVKYNFDLVLTFNESKLIDINFRNWEYNNKDKFELFDGVVSTPLRWVEILMPEIYERLKEILQEISGKYIDKINNSTINKKSYSSYKLFKNIHINYDEKLYILQRYGLIKTIMFIEEILNEKISFYIGEFHFDFEKFIDKSKATIIEIFWNDRKTNDNLHILDTIFEENKKKIDKTFYAINRKCRNNLHYSDYHQLSATEKQILHDNQNKYLSNVSMIFDKNLTYNFGLDYKIALFFAKLKYWNRT